jgi:hypothetical protein
VNPAKQTWPLSSIVLALSGLAVVGIGLFFILLRPPLLPEDTRYIGITLEQLQTTQPRLASWLTHVFRVLGGYVLATGVLTVALALTSFRQHQKAAGVGAFLAGAVSIGWMAVVNFLINSDFKWMLLGIALLWLVGLVLFWFEIRSSHVNENRPV